MEKCFYESDFYRQHRKATELIGLLICTGFCGIGDDLSRIQRETQKREYREKYFREYGEYPPEESLPEKVDYGQYRESIDRSD